MLRILMTIVIFTSIFASSIFAGSLSGRVNFKGKGPKKKALRMDADPACGSAHSGPVYNENFKMDEDGSMEEALVYLRDVSYSKGVPSEPAILDQKGCVYNLNFDYLLAESMSLLT